MPLSPFPVMYLFVWDVGLQGEIEGVRERQGRSIGAGILG
jgi:hypothetical protein